MKFALIILLLFCPLCFKGQIIQLQRVDVESDFGDLMIAKLFDRTNPAETQSIFYIKEILKVDWLGDEYIPKVMKIYSDSTHIIEFNKLNENSVLRIQIDSVGGYLDICGLHTILTDTIKISDLKLVQNSLPLIAVVDIGYRKHPERRDSLNPKRSLLKREIIRKGNENDSTLTYSFTINGTKYSADLIIEESLQSIHYSGVTRLKWYNLRYKLYGRSPKRYISWSGSVYELYKFWAGKLELH